MFKHLFKKQPEEYATEAIQATNELQSEYLEDALINISKLFGIVSGSLTKHTVIPDNPALKPHLTKIELTTLDNHIITLEASTNVTIDNSGYHNPLSFIMVKLDDYEREAVPYYRIVKYLGKHGLHLKDSLTILATVKRLQLAYPDSTLYTETLITNWLDITVPSLVHIVSKQNKTILATVELVGEDTLVALSTIPKAINLGSEPTEEKVATFIDAFIL